MTRSNPYSLVHDNPSIDPEPEEERCPRFVAFWGAVLASCLVWLGMFALLMRYCG